jgi:hypothetical protein
MLQKELLFVNGKESERSQMMEQLTREKQELLVQMNDVKNDLSQKSLLVQKYKEENDLLLPQLNELRSKFYK